MACEKHRLLGVGAKPADDDERDAVARRRRRQPVEGRGDVGTHRLALPVGQRPAVLAGPRGLRRELRRRRELGLRARPRGDAPAAPDLEVVADLHAHAHGRERRRVGKAHRDPFGAVAGGGRDGGTPPEREVGAALEVRRVRVAAEQRHLEEPLIGLVHRARSGERGEVGRTLLIAVGTDPLRDRAEHERAKQQRQRETEHEDRRLARRLAPPRRGRSTPHADSSATGPASARRIDGRSAAPAAASERAG
jgi:hypothetical protein